MLSAEPTQPRSAASTGMLGLVPLIAACMWARRHFCLLPFPSHHSAQHLQQQQPCLQPSVCAPCTPLSAAFNSHHTSCHVEKSQIAAQVFASAYHLLRRHFSQEEAVLPQLCQHCNLWSPRHIHCLCSHRLRPVRLLQASQCAQLLGMSYCNIVRCRLPSTTSVDFALRQT